MKYTARVRIDLSFYFDPIVDAKDEEEAWEKVQQAITLADFQSQLQEAWAFADDSNYIAVQMRSAVEVDDIEELQ